MRHGFIGPDSIAAPDQRKRLLRSLMGALFRHDHITTTEARAKELRRHAERLITTARRGDLHSRRLALSTPPRSARRGAPLPHRGPPLQGAPGGYTRITRIGRRQGDGATVVQIELLDREPTPSCPPPASALPRLPPSAVPHGPCAPPSRTGAPGTWDFGPPCD